jgi:hypothetical protein
MKIFKTKTFFIQQPTQQQCRKEKVKLQEEWKRES